MFLLFFTKTCFFKLLTQSKSCMRLVFQWTWTSCSTWFRWRSRTRWSRKPWRWSCLPLRWWHKEEYAITSLKDLQDTPPTRLGCNVKLFKKWFFNCCENLILLGHFNLLRHLIFWATFQFCLRRSYFVECHLWSMNTEYKQNWSVLQLQGKLKKNLIKKKLKIK